MLPARHQRVFTLETDFQLTAAYHPIHLRIPGAQVGSADRLEADPAPFLGLEPAEDPRGEWQRGDEQ